jgi:hypothetical protein
MTPELRAMLELEAINQEILRDELEKKGLELGGAVNDNIPYWKNYHAYIAARCKAERIRMVLSAYSNPADGEVS